MEAVRCEASLETDSSFSGAVEVPVRERTVEQGKAVLDEPVLDEPPNTNNPLQHSNSALSPSITLDRAAAAQKNGSPDKGKALIDSEPSQVELKPENTLKRDEPKPENTLKRDEPKPENTLKRDEPEPSFNIYLQPKEGAEDSPRSPPPPRFPITCRFCSQEFSTTQALGGHQNAHKEEREMQKVMKAAQELGRSSLLYQFSRARAPGFQGSYYGNPFAFPPYLAPRGWQPRPTFPYPYTSIGRGPTGFGRAIQGFVGPSATNPVGVAYDSSGHASGPTGRYTGSTNFHPVASYSQEMQHAAKRQRIDPMGLDLSLKCSEPEKIDLSSESNESADLPKEHNESTELDLTLKL